MNNLKICSFNVKNDNLAKKINKEKIKDIFIELLEKYEIDILATQEMISSTVHKIKKIKKYKVVGNYRYNNLLKRIKKIEKYNEANNIITHLTIIDNKTERLPWIPKNIKELFKGIFKYHSIIPRIVTKAIIEIDNNKIEVINTHLSLHINSVKKSQLDKIKKRIEEAKYPVILTGDFNTNYEDEIFNKFINDLSELGLKRIEINEKTFKKSKNNLPIDHIFIPQEWELVNYNVINDKFIDDYSDHYPLLIEVIPKF